jgi:hypothetical protein
MVISTFETLPLFALIGLDHGIGHVASMSLEKNERLTSRKD